MTSPHRGIKSHFAATLVRTRLRMLPLALAATLALVGQTSGEHLDEYRIKAAFLFHFAQLVDWPSASSTANRDTNICLIASGPFHNEVRTLDGKMIRSGVVHVRALDTADDAGNCNLLFVAERDRNKVTAILSHLRNTPILTVGEGEEFVKRGGMIAFCWEGSKVRFEINVDAAERAGIKISSRLLLLAKAVVGQTRGT